MHCPQRRQLSNPSPLLRPPGDRRRGEIALRERGPAAHACAAWGVTPAPRLQDIQVIPGTSSPKLCMLSDEYSPSVAVFDCDFGSASCGQVGDARRVMRAWSEQALQRVAATHARAPLRFPRAGQGPVRAQRPRQELHRRLQLHRLPSQGHPPRHAAEPEVQQGSGEPCHLP